MTFLGGIHVTLNIPCSGNLEIHLEVSDKSSTDAGSEIDSSEDKKLNNGGCDSEIEEIESASEMTTTNTHCLGRHTTDLPCLFYHTQRSMASSEQLSARCFKSWRTIVTLGIVDNFGRAEAVLR